MQLTPPLSPPARPRPSPWRSRCRVGSSPAGRRRRMPGRDPYPQLLGGGGPILRPRPLDGRPALAASAVSGVVESGPPKQSRSSTWANIKWFPRGVEAAGVPPAAVPPPLSTIFFSSSACDAQKKKQLTGSASVFRGGFDALLVPGQGIPCLNADPVRGSSSSLNARMT